jgi:hypothetical protein
VNLNAGISLPRRAVVRLPMKQPCRKLDMNQPIESNHFPSGLARRLSDRQEEPGVVNKRCDQARTSVRCDTGSAIFGQVPPARY